MLRLCSMSILPFTCKMNLKDQLYLNATMNQSLLQLLISTNITGSVKNLIGCSLLCERSPVLEDFAPSEAKCGLIVVVRMSPHYSDITLIGDGKIKSVASIPLQYSNMECEANRDNLLSPHVVEWLSEGDC